MLRRYIASASQVSASALGWPIGIKADMRPGHVEVAKLRAVIVERVPELLVAIMTPAP